MQCPKENNSQALRFPLYRLRYRASDCVESHTLVIIQGRGFHLVRHSIDLGGKLHNAVKAVSFKRKATKLTLWESSARVAPERSTSRVMACHSRRAFSAHIKFIRAERQSTRQHLQLSPALPSRTHRKRRAQCRLLGAEKRLRRTTRLN